MAVLLAACITSFLICVIVLPVIIKYSLSKNLGDVPGRRKIHKKVTPSLGGIAIFIGFIASTLIWLDFDAWQTTRYVLASLSLVFLLGVRDDLVPLRALHKLYGQIVAVVILLFSSVRLTGFYGLVDADIPLAVCYVLTGFVIILVTNSFNLIDGLDGLAGSVGMISLLALGIWFFMVDETIFSLFCFAMIGGIVAFLVFNWEPSEIFMGDTGAMVIGMLLAVSVIHFMNINFTLPPNHPARFSATIGTGVCFIIVPLMDTLRIIILRTLKGQSPFHPDKSHIHHAIMRLGMTHAKTALILGSLNLFCIVIAILLRSSPDVVLLPVIITLGIIFSVLLDRLILNKLTSKA